MSIYLTALFILLTLLNYLLLEQIKASLTKASITKTALTDNKEPLLKLSLVVFSIFI